MSETLPAIRKCNEKNCTKKALSFNPKCKKHWHAAAQTKKGL